MTRVLVKIGRVPRAAPHHRGYRVVRLSSIVRLSDAAATWRWAKLQTLRTTAARGVLARLGRSVTQQELRPQRQASQDTLPIVLDFDRQTVRTHQVIEQVEPRVDLVMSDRHP